MPVVRVRIAPWRHPLLLPEVASGALVTALLWGWLAPCSYQCCGLGHCYVRFLHHVWDPLGPLQWGRGWVRWGAGVWCCYHIQGYQFHGHCCCGQRGQSPMGLCDLEGWCRYCCLGHCCGCGSRISGATSTVSPVLPPLCISVHPLFFFFFFFGHAVCGILVPQQGSKQTRPLAVRVWHPDYWTAREFSVCPVLRTVVQMCGNLCNPGVLGRDIFTELKIFYC